MSTKSAAIALSCLLAAARGGIAANAPVPCSRILTEGEVKAAAGPGWTNLGQEETESGKSECTWLRQDGANPKAIVFTWWTRDAVKGSSLADYFEAQAKRAETVHENRREALEGIGEGAVLVPGKKPGAMAVLVIRTAAGVAYIETDYLERPQLLRLARAIAAP